MMKTIDDDTNFIIYSKIICRSCLKKMEVINELFIEHFQQNAW